MAYARQCEACGALVYGRQEPKAVAHVCPAAFEARLALIERALTTGRTPYIATPGPVPDEKPGAIHHRETLADVLEQIAVRNADKALDTRGVIVTGRTTHVRGKRTPNHIEDTLVQKANDLRSELDAVLDTKRESHRPARRRRWWRLWT